MNIGGTVWAYILLIVSVFLTVVFITAFLNNRYRFRCGLLFFLMSSSIFLSAFAWSPGRTVSLAVLIAGIVPFILLFVSFLFFLGALFFNGIVLLRKEGFSLQNCLSLLLLIYIVSLPFLTAFLKGFARNPAVSFMISALAVVTLYLFLAAIVYVTSGLLVVLTPQRKPVDYIIVLGCGLLNGEEATPLLKGRVDKGIELYKKNPERSFLLMSGGQGNDEKIPEAQAMKKYALAAGIPEDHILTEEKSKNTDENMKFSRNLILSRGTEHPSVAFATNRFHQFRAGVYAFRNGMNIRGVGSRTKLYYAQNASIREFIALIAIGWKYHAAIIGSLLAFVLLLMLIF